MIFLSSVVYIVMFILILFIFISCFNYLGELSAVFTPDRPITASEVTAGGSRVVLAMEGSHTLTTLQLTSATVGHTATEPTPVYGLAENTGLTFDLEER